MPAVLIQWVRAALLFIALGLSAGIAGAQELQPVPDLTGHVIDTTATLDDAQRQALEARLATFERDKGAQVVLLMVATTQPEDIASYANRVGNAWKIGRKDVGDGLILLVAKNDRKVRIEVAKTLEGAVPDLAAKQIIDEAITPRFRQGDFAGGLEAAAGQIMARISGEALPSPGESGVAPGGFPMADWFEVAGILVFAMFFAVPIGGAVARSLLGRKLGAVATGGGVGALAIYLTAPFWIASAAALIALLLTLLSGTGTVVRSRGAGRSGRNNNGSWTSAGWGGGASGSSSSSDSFSSGGGGDFGGGGASGDW